MSRYASYEDIITGSADSDHRVQQILKDQAGFTKLQLQNLEDCSNRSFTLEWRRVFKLVLPTSSFVFHVIWKSCLLACAGRDTR